MKKLFNNSKACVLALSTLFFIASSFTTVTKNNTELKYVGSTTNAAVFQLSMNNEEQNEYLVAIKNAQDETLYSEKVKGENISKRYKLTNTDVSAIEGFVFEVTNKKTKEKTVYKISSSVSVTQNISVAVL